jgi:hypothetical protein
MTVRHAHKSYSLVAFLIVLAITTTTAATDFVSSDYEALPYTVMTRQS